MIVFTLIWVMGVNLSDYLYYAVVQKYLFIVANIDVPTVMYSNLSK